MLRNKTAIALCLIMTACAPVHQLNMVAVSEGKRASVKIEQTEFFANALLERPLGSQKTVPGDGQVISLSLGFKGPEGGKDVESLIKFADYLRYYLKIEWPGTIGPDTLLLADRSFAWLMGQYDVPQDQRLYIARSGHLVIDSIVKQEAFCSLDGAFINSVPETVEFVGRFRLKIGR